MYCEKCQKKFPDAHRFCSDCGKPLVKQKLGTLYLPAVILAGMFTAGLLVWLFV